MSRSEELETLRITCSGPVLEIIFSRPDQRNSINVTFLSELDQALDMAERDAGCRVIVLAGSGPEAVFCTGMDFDAMGRAPAASPAPDAAPYMALLKRFTQIPRVVIANVQGTVMAGGVGLVAASDLVIASPKATFMLSEALWGLLPAMVTPFLIRRVGFQKAYSMALSTRSHSASEALAMGLADVVTGDPAQEIQASVRRLARIEPSTMGDLKAFFRKMWFVTEAMEQTAVAELVRLMEQPRVQKNIRDYVELGKFPWEKW